MTTYPIQKKEFDRYKVSFTTFIPHTEFKDDRKGGLNDYKLDAEASRVYCEYMLSLSKIDRKYRRIKILTWAIIFVIILAFQILI